MQTCQRFPLSLIAVALMMSGLAHAEDKKSEVIQVVGKKHQHSAAPAAQSIILDADSFSPSVSNLTDLIADTPGVALSGQGGLFQVYSVRGMSRWRVLTQIAGMPIHTERRAGTAASFMSPWLMEQVEVIKGPVSTFYGSGGLAGVTQIDAAQFDGLQLQTGFSSGGQSRHQNLGWGDGQYSFGLSHRQEKNSRTPSGDPINDHYRQTSFSAMGNWAVTRDIDSRLMVLGSLGKDIGKANNEDFINSKYTVYPEEQHWIAQYALQSNTGWQGHLAVHRQTLDTEVTRFDKRVNTVDTAATDYNLSFQQSWETSDFDGQWGFEQEIRDNIRGSEAERSLTDDSRSGSTVLAANQWRSAAFANINSRIDDWSFSAGARASYIKQGSDVQSHSDRSDEAITGYASAAWAFAPEWQFTSAISTGFRFPTLTERFYHGTTARGNTYGNPDLRAETARNLEFGLGWQTDNRQLQINAFHNSIDNYIERIDVDDDTRTYRNLHEGTIKGLELSFSQQLGEAFSYTVSGHHLNGEDEHGNPLGDIAPNKLRLQLNYTAQQWDAGFTINHRFDHHDVASGEKPINAVDTVKAHVNYLLSERWKLSLWADNLLDKEYRLTTDKKSGLSSERQFGINVTWAME